MCPICNKKVEWRPLEWNDDYLILCRDVDESLHLYSRVNDKNMCKEITYWFDGFRADINIINQSLKFWRDNRFIGEIDNFTKEFNEETMAYIKNYFIL